MSKMSKTLKKLEQALKLVDIIERKYKFVYGGTIYPEQFDKEKGPGMSKYLKTECFIDEAIYLSWLKDAGYSEKDIKELKDDAKKRIEIYKKNEKKIHNS